MGEAASEELLQGLNGNNEKIFVSVRLRPLNEKEIMRNDVSDWECINDNTIIFRNNSPVSERSMYPTSYSFDRVFRCDCSTRQVYVEGAKEVALSVVNGINSSVFAYGQTSSGKTYTMSGITEYTVADIFDYIERHKEREFHLTFSAMEIYNESVRDLLSADSTPLRLLDDPERGTTVEKLREETLTDWNDFRELLSICEAQRQIGETFLNEASSRSHQILRLTIESSALEFSDKNKSSSLMATVNFVDLAGSERASQSLSAGTRLKEGCHINRSLLTLGTVIRKLSKGRNGHIPFRDSKLTRILQSSLAGNARTAIICTMSPARIHVEQSRNTLLFASCAKEVTTKAQVNIIMSDKALVKHLQRELARLESEFTSSGPTPVSAILLREKDLEIEKLKKEITELTLQRDLAQSQVKDLLRVVGDDRPSMLQSGPEHQYPQLRVRNSWKYENPVSDSDSHCLYVVDRSFDTSQYSGVSSRSSYDDRIQLPDVKDNFMQTDTSPQLSVNIHNCVATGICQEANENLEDLCKVVRCIEIEESSTNRYEQSNMSSCAEKMGIVALGVDEKGDEANKNLASFQIKEDKVLNLHQDFVVRSPKKLSPELGRYMASSESVKLTRNISCKVSPVTSLSSLWFEEVEINGNTPPIGFEKDFTGRPEVFRGNQSALKYSAETERFSRNSSQTSVGSADIDEMKMQTIETSSDEKSSDATLSRNGSQTSEGSAAVNELIVENIERSMDEKGTNNTSPLILPTKQTADLQIEKQFIENALPEGEPMPTAKNVKDVGLDPIQDDSESSTNWPSEYKRIQKEIIELWHACNVSLVHRTFFFLLFKGDPTDSVYMEVEIRQLSFIKDTFSQGNGTMEDGWTLTTASSMRDLRSERLWLSKQMLKRFSEEDRENLYLKWGIRLNTKHRRFQLAHRLWTDPNNMDHITESATIIAKLVGFTKPEHAFKEMFGLNFAPRRTSRKIFNWKLSAMSLS